MAQVNPLVGDIPGNTDMVIETVGKILAKQAPDMIVFPELVLTAYPPKTCCCAPVSTYAFTMPWRAFWPAISLPTW